jgi:drug/metabolite transporter (DMT)-like permease
MNVKKSYIKYFASLLIFGMNGIVASFIHLSSYEIVFMRTLIGSLLLIFIFLFKRQKSTILQEKKAGFYLLLSGIAMGAGSLLVYEAYQQIGVGIASLLYYCGPVFVMILAPILFREKLNMTKTIGFAFVLLGMFVINMQAMNGGNNLTGTLLGVMSAVMFAIMVICSKKSQRITGLENSMWQLIFCFLTAFLFVGFKQGFAIHIEPTNLLPIIILGVINTGLGCFFYFSSIGDLPVQTVSICGYLEPLSAVMFSMVFLHESMTLTQVLGAVLIVGGVVFGELFHVVLTKRKLIYHNI